MRTFRGALQRLFSIDELHVRRLYVLDDHDRLVARLSADNGSGVVEVLDPSSRATATLDAAQGRPRLKLPEYGEHQVGR
ncbi:MAG: hypothetical protein AAGG38_10815 [Planctomycetota bacterium]